MVSAPSQRQLREYQREASDAAIKSVEDGKLSPLVVLPTSMGKTYLAIEVYRKLRESGKIAGKLLWMVQSKELLEQAEKSFSSAFPELKIGFEQGSNKSSASDDIVISMIQSLKNDRMVNFLQGREEKVGMIVIDEAHHAAAPSYRDLIETYQKTNPNGVLLGLTATPDRSDAQDIRDIFDLAYEMSLPRAIDDAWQPNLNLWTVRTTSDLSDVEIRGGKYGRGDYIESSLAHAVNTLNRNAGVVSSYVNLEKKMGRVPHSIVFSADVAHAKDLASAFIHEGISAVAIDGSMDSEERKRLVADFRSGKIKVLCNCNCTTEGFDVPTLDAVLLARPTRSKLLLTQQIGRATRLHPDISSKISSCASVTERQKLIASSIKPSVHIIDFVDILGNLEQDKLPIQSSDVLGIPRSMANDGLETQKTRKFFAEAEILGVNIRTARDLKDVYVQMRVAKVMKPKVAEHPFTKMTNLSLISLSDGSVILPVPTKDGKVFRIERTLENKWQIFSYDKEKKREILSGSISTLHRAIVTLESRLKILNQSIKLLTQDAKWRSEDITEKQQKYLAKHGLVMPLNRGNAYDTIICMKANKTLSSSPQDVSQSLSLESSFNQQVNFLKDTPFEQPPSQLFSRKPFVKNPQSFKKNSDKSESVIYQGSDLLGVLPITKGQVYILMNAYAYKKEDLPKTFDGAHLLLSQFSKYARKERSLA